jgi:hypothetical protein
MSYVPRSPRRATRLRAVVDGVVAGGALHAVGAVRDMSTSGMFLDAPAKLPIGAQLAVVPLLGELDGERLPAEVARVAERGLAVRFVGLDPDVRQRLRRTFAADEPQHLIASPSAPHAFARGGPQRPTLQPVPDDAPVVLLTDEPAPPEKPRERSGDVLTVMRGTIERLEAQLFEAARAKHGILEDNGRLKRESMSLQARLSVALSLRLRVDDDLTEARASVDDLERAEDALIRRIQTLEELLRRAMIAGW